MGILKIFEPCIVHEDENPRDVDANLAFDEYLLHFQQNGAPLHLTLSVREWLDNHLPEQWISRRSTFEWPTRSPDLTLFDLSLLGHLKFGVFKTQPDSLQEPQQRIVLECWFISLENSKRSASNFHINCTCDYNKFKTI